MRVRLITLIMVLNILLAACSGKTTQVPVIIPPAPSITISPAFTISPSSTASPTPAQTPTTIPCDPSTGYCIHEGYFVLERPISLPGNDLVDRIYPYGSTDNGTRDPHHGVEFANATGTPVLASASGLVIYAGDDLTQKFSPWTNFYGNLVIIKHELPDTPASTLYTLYAHLSKTDVITGQPVTTGQKIGEVGRTGAAIGSHLHFEVRLVAEDYMSSLNPELWLVPHPSTGVLALRARNEAGDLLNISPAVQYYPDRSQPAAWNIQLEPYAPETINPRDPWQETYALGELPAGEFRLAFIWMGVVYERWVEVDAVKLTLTEFIIQ